jgi:hypothetical protein
MCLSITALFLSLPTFAQNLEKPGYDLTCATLSPFQEELLSRRGGPSSVVDWVTKGFRIVLIQKTTGFVTGDTGDTLEMKTLNCVAILREGILPEVYYFREIQVAPDGVMTTLEWRSYTPPPKDWVRYPETERLSNF